jgi:hypothetical protein
VREIEVFIDTEEIGNFLFNKLIQKGIVPSEDEINEIADIMFDYLIHKEIIDEEDKN